MIYLLLAFLVLLCELMRRCISVREMGYMPPRGLHLI